MKYAIEIMPLAFSRVFYSICTSDLIETGATMRLLPIRALKSLLTFALNTLPIMAKSVFISHSSKDKEIADELCERLENIGISCWIAPRDIPPGSAYGAAIIDGIAACSVFLLILSENSNASPAVQAEVERSFNYQKLIVPLRIRDIEASKGIEFYISEKQWLDAFASPIDAHVEYLASVVKAVETKSALPTRPGHSPKLKTDSGQNFPNQKRRTGGLAAKVIGFSVIAGAIILLAGQFTGNSSVSNKSIQPIGRATSATASPPHSSREAEQTSAALAGEPSKKPAVSVYASSPSNTSPGKKPTDLSRLVNAFAIPWERKGSESAWTNLDDAGASWDGGVVSANWIHTRKGTISTANFGTVKLKANGEKETFNQLQATVNIKKPSGQITKKYLNQIIGDDFLLETSLKQCETFSSFKPYGGFNISFILTHQRYEPLMVDIVYAPDFDDLGKKKADGSGELEFRFRREGGKCY